VTIKSKSTIAMKKIPLMRCNSSGHDRNEDQLQINTNFCIDINLKPENTDAKIVAALKAYLFCV
jgi:hypothetical protein